MSKPTTIVYTSHAREKFELLARYGFPITQQQVEDTIREPTLVIEQTGGRLIAQKEIGQLHLLRVIYRIEGQFAIVITFYPARRRRYET